MDNSIQIPVASKEVKEMSVQSHGSLLDIHYAATADSPLQTLMLQTQSVHQYEEMVKWLTKPNCKTEN
jgi:hypothetical protein